MLYGKGNPNGEVMGKNVATAHLNKPANWNCRNGQQKKFYVPLFLSLQFLILANCIQLHVCFR